MSHNTLIHSIVRPAVRWVAPSGVTPNQLTTLRLITGLAAAAGFSRDGSLWPAVGGVLFVVSMLLDRADGELARQTGQSSLAGYRYDLVCDCLVNVLTFLALGFGPTDDLGAGAIVLGVVAGAAIGILFWQLNVLKLSEVRGYELFGGRVVVDPDDAMIFVPILVWCRASSPMLVAAGVITPVAAVVLALLAFNARRRATWAGPDPAE